MGCEIEIEKDVAWPYPEDRFPASLGVIVQRTVLEGRELARAVVHDSDGYWLVSDQVNDPNAPDAAVLVCARCLLDADPSLESLATMPPGTYAWRDERDDEWEFDEHSYDDEDE